MGNKKSKVYAIENSKVVYQDGYYDGPTVNGQPNGWGTFYYNNGEYCSLNSNKSNTLLCSIIIDNDNEIN